MVGYKLEESCSEYTIIRKVHFKKKTIMNQAGYIKLWKSESIEKIWQFKIHKLKPSKYIQSKTWQKKIDPIIVVDVSLSHFHK